MSKWLDIRDLLRFEASADGTSASLIAVERHGELIALNFTVTCLSRLMLTLPKMIDAVVQQRGNHPGLRVVYPLDMLRVELAGDRTRILTLSTPDGFAISFTASAEKFAQIREIFAGGARRSGSASEKCSFSKRYTRQTIGACRPQIGDVELLEGARLSKQIAAPAQVSNWHTTSNRCGAKVRTRSKRSGHAESVGSGSI
jgi:hypothetical protein